MKLPSAAAMVLTGVRCLSYPHNLPVIVLLWSYGIFPSDDDIWRLAACNQKRENSLKGQAWE